MELFTSHLRDRLAEKLAAPVDLILTDNLRSMIYIRPHSENGFRIRLHHMFLDADDAVLDELVRFAQGKKAPGLQLFIDKNAPLVGKRKKRHKLSIQGKKYNLKKVFDAINQEWFDNQLDARITWGRRTGDSNRRSIQFGSYLPGEHLIRINARLDEEDIPEIFLKYVVYHEMLHADMGGHRHNREFKDREKQWPGYQEAQLWQKKNIKLFIR